MNWKKLWFGLIAIGIPLVLLGQTIRWYNDPLIPHKSALEGNEIISVQQTGPNAYRWAYVSDMLGSPTNPAPNIYVSNLYTTNAYITNLYTTNAYITNVTVQNIDAKGKVTIAYLNATTNYYFFTTNLYLNNNYVSNYFTTNVLNYNWVSNYLVTAYYVTNQYTTNLYSTNIVNNNSFVSNFWQTNIFVNDTYVSNYFTTNLFSTTVTNIYNTLNQTIITNLYTTNLYSTYNYLTNIYTDYTYVTNLYATYVNPVSNYYFFTTNLYLTDNYVSNYFTTNVFNDTYVSNFLQTNVYVTNQYVTNLYSTNIINNNSYVSNFWQTNINVNDTYVSNFYTTNIFNTFNTNIYNTFNLVNLTNATLYGTTLFAPVSGTEPGYVGVQNAGVDVVALNATNGTVSATNFLPRNVPWIGPTNTLNLANGNLRTYTTYTPASITNVTGAVAGFGNSCLLSISNAAATNVSVYAPSGWKLGWGETSPYTLTNADVLKLWLYEVDGEKTICTRGFH